MATYKVIFKWTKTGVTPPLEVEADSPEEAVAQAYEDWGGGPDQETIEKARSSTVRVSAMSCDGEPIVVPAGWASRAAGDGALDVMVPELQPFTGERPPSEKPPGS